MREWTLVFAGTYFYAAFLKFSQSHLGHINYVKYTIPEQAIYWFLYSPIDSWFEKVHPLHEPKDPLHHDGTTKPLLTTAQVNKAASSSSLKPQTNKPKKNYNSKKSLGIKSIRTRRGQHENASNRQSSGKGLKNGPSQKADRQVYLNDGKKDVSNMEEGRVTPDGIKHNNECSFTPPWSNSSINKTGNRGKLLSSSLWIS